MTVGTVHSRPRAVGPRGRSSKLVGLAFLTPPVALFAGFGVAEAIGGEEGWWGHVVQLAVVALLALSAWVWPRVGGFALIMAGIAFAVWVIAVSEFPGGLAALAIVGVPLILSGAFFTRAGRAG